MLDLFDEVPEEEGADPLVAALEQRSAVVEHHLEERSKRRFEVRDVGEVELEILVREQLVVRGVGLGHRSLEARVLADH